MLDQSLSLGSAEAFVWRQRLRDEAAMHNITDKHVRILDYMRGALDEGHDQMSHGDIAEALHVGKRTVGDALARAKGIGLLDWEHQYRPFGGQRRQTVNRYWLTMPVSSPMPRPDLRRHRISGVRRPSEVSKQEEKSWQELVTERDRRADQAALAERRAVIEGRLLMKAAAGRFPAS